MATEGQARDTYQATRDFYKGDSHTIHGTRGLAKSQLKDRSARTSSSAS
jgi:hypothetical protein